MAGRAVLVTGASTGIGAATAEHLAGIGYTVFAGVRKEADREALAGRPGVRPLHLDVTEDDAIAAAVVQIERETQSLAGLVNNAGVALAAPLEYMPLQVFRRQIDVNLTGQLAVTQAMLPLLRRGRGRVVNLGSIGDRIASPMNGAYHASKFALAGMTATLRLELAPWGIEVVLVEPGTIATQIWQTGVSAADELIARMPPDAGDRYGKVIAATRAWAVQSARTGIAPVEVARVIGRALTTPRPRTRYLVGRDAKVLSVLALLPDRLRDRLILRRLQRASEGR